MFASKLQEMRHFYYRAIKPDCEDNVEFIRDVVSSFLLSGHRLRFTHASLQDFGAKQLLLNCEMKDHHSAAAVFRKTAPLTVPPFKSLATFMCPLFRISTRWCSPQMIPAWELIRACPNAFSQARSTYRLYRWDS